MKILLSVVAVLVFLGCVGGSPVYCPDLSVLRKVCIEGHVYFYRDHSNGGLASKLNDDGTPCKCQSNEEEWKRIKK